MDSYGSGRGHPWRGAVALASLLVCTAAHEKAAASDGKGLGPPPAVLTVGPGGGAPCDFPGIQAAIDAAPANATIRVSNSVNFAGSLVVTDRSLTLAGGYSACDDDSPDPALPSVANSGGLTTLRVEHTGGPAMQVRVQDFVLRIGDGGATHGGGVDLSGDVRLVLDRVRVQENSAQFGGGIRIRGGAIRPTLVLDGGTRVGGSAAFVETNNATQDGGGIHCLDGDIEWVDASIQFNTSVNGAGMFLNGCTLTTPPAAPGPMRELRIADNRAELGAGGGIHAGNGSTLVLSSDPQRRVRIIRNFAALSGGGAYLGGAVLAGDGIEIDRNSAGTTGGGLAMSGAELDLDRGSPTGSNCGGRLRCSSVSNNTAAGNGGAIWAFNAGLDLRQTFLDQNQAANAAALSITGNSTLLMHGVQLSGNVATNGANTQLLFSSSADLELRHATIAANDVDRVFRIIFNASLALADSIVWQPGSAIVSGDGSESVNSTCVNASDALSFPAATHDPGFRVVGTTPVPAPALYLAEDSANLDACDDAPAPNPAFDAAGRIRVVDLPDVIDLDGPLDRGAFEQSGPLLSDGFES